MPHFLSWLCFILFVSNKLKNISALPSLEDEEILPSRVLLRRELDEMTQKFLIERDSNTHPYHSYIFNSGIGNREELQVEMLKKDPNFAAGEGVLSWQSVQCGGSLYLLGRKLTSVCLVVSSTQILSNRSAQFTEHIIDIGANVSSTAMFIRSDHTISHPDVIAVIAVDNPSADLLWFRVKDNKMELIKRRNHYTRTTAMAALSVGGRNQLVLVDTGSPANVDVYEIVFESNGSSLGLSLLQNFSLICECLSVTVFSVGQQLFLAFPLPCNESMTVHWLVTVAKSPLFEHHRTLSLPRVSQVSTFKLAQQVYLAVNGDRSYVLRVTESGDFIEELSLDYTNEWLAIPVNSYRDDVALFSRSANRTELFVWAGTMKGFKSIPVPECDSCLSGDWLGATSVPLHHQHSVLLPQAKSTSSLITVVTSLIEKNNPVLIELINSIIDYEGIWKKLQSQISEAEQILRYKVNVSGTNNITAKWKIKYLETPDLHLNSLVVPKSEQDTSGESEPDLSSLEGQVNDTMRRGKELIKAVDERDRQVWGLEGFRGKVIVKGRLVIENLTVGYLNGHSMDNLLSDTFRKSMPQKILSNTVVEESVQTENFIVQNINNNAVEESLKFNDKPMVIKGNITFLSPVAVDGDVELSASGTINGMYLSALCEGKANCAVYPMEYQEEHNVLDNTVKGDDSVDEGYIWEKVLGGKNLTVIKVNGVTWENLNKNVVYKNRYQNVPGTMIVKGILSSEGSVMTHRIKYKPKKRESENMMLQMLPDRKIPSAGSMLLEEILTIDPERDVIFSDLEVLGTVSCAESEWGEAAADVVLSTANPIKIQAHKVFSSGISVAKNLDVKGSVAGVPMKDFLTSDTDQVFDGTTTLQGNIILGNVTLGGLWNGVNISSSSDNKLSSFLSRELRHLSQNELAVDTLRVTETFNGVPVSELVYTSNDVMSVRQLTAATADVTENINVVGKICGYSLNEFDKTRLSIEREQNITGEFFIDKVHLKSNLNVSLLNNREMSHLMDDFFGNLNNIEELNLAALHVDGDITTDFGMNGHNLSEIAAHAIWLFSNHEIEGPLIFKDELTVNLLECQGFLNNKPCQNRLDDTDVVYKNNGTVHLSGKIQFKNVLNVSEDLKLEEINGNKVDDILTKTTEQEISGDIFITGEMVVDGESYVEGLLNDRDISEFGTKCILVNSTITCAGDIHFKDTVNVTHFISEGSINGKDFDLFTKSLVDVYKIDYISGFKNFTGKTTVINELTVRTVNNHNWNDFVLNAVNQNAIEDVDPPITFKEKVVAQQISVDYNINADSINDLNLTEWQSNAIYIKNNFTLSRPLHLESASSLGNITVDRYGDLTLELEVIKLDSNTIMNDLRFKSVTVIEEANIDSTVNGHQLETLQKNTFKVSGDQTVTADLVMLEDVSVSGNVDTLGHVNNIDLRDVVTLNTDQTLHGRYKFECVEAMQNLTATRKMSGLNMSEWKEVAVVQEKQQEVSGVWRIRGHLDLKGPVTGPGSLGDVDLQELTDNITRDIIEVHGEMKANLSKVCDDTNQHLNKARNQTSELLYVDIAQEITMPNVVSLVKHFKSAHEDFLAVCEESCRTTMFKWDRKRGMFSKLYNQVLSFGVSQMVELQHNNQIYLLAESSEQLKDCLYTGKQLWLFSEVQLTHVSSVDFLSGKILQGHANLFYTMNSTGVFEWSIDTLSGTLFKMSKKWETNSVVEENPLIQVAGLPTENFTEVASMESVLNTIPELLSSCGGEVLSLSVCPTHQFIAVATAEKTQVPRYSDHVKVYSYKQSSQLLDMLPAQRPSHLQWLHVPYQTWLVFMQNNTSLQLFHYQEGFQLRLSAKLEASDLISLSLPLASRVSLQPYLVVHSGSSVKILRAVLQGDPFLGEDIICSFDEALLRVPGNI